MKQISKSSQSKDSSGFTLVELLIAITMFSFVLLLVASTFLQINRSYTYGLTTKRVHEEGRTTLENIKRDVRMGSSGDQMVIECEGSDPCGNNDPTTLLCFDSTAYMFSPPTAEANGSLRVAEGVNCFGDVDPSSGQNVFGDLLQPQFFKVSRIGEVVPTYRIELIVSTASYSNDLLIDGSTSPRQVACDVSAKGSQFCRVVYLQTLVTLRNN